MSLKETRTGITKNVHFDPLFMRLVYKEPPVCGAGIIQEFSFAACTGSPAHLDAFGHAHTIHLSFSMRAAC
jgi:hypothetical protein